MVTSLARCLVLAGGLLLVVAPTAHANAGTPLMWAGAFHLLFGNLAIGIAEGVLIARVARAPYRRSIGLMVAANYASAWLGILAIDECVPLRDEWLGAEPLFRAGECVLIAAAASFVLTIALEWPFCRWVLGSRSRAWSKALLASLAAQVLSYGVLVPYYYRASGLGVVREVERDRTLTRPAEPRAVVFFLGDDGDLYRLRATDTQPAKVASCGIVTRYAELYLQASEHTPGMADVWVAYADAPTLTHRLAREAVAWSGAIHRPSSKHASDLVPVEAREWQVYTGYRTAEGLWADHRRGATVRVSLDTPFLSWFARWATILPGHQVVFELGPQIVVLDLPTRRIGLVARGHSPLVVLERP